MNEWKGARTMEELCELAALQLEGKIEPGQPGSGIFREEDESHPIRDDLAYLDRHGLMTTVSQPGQRIDRTGCGQRAAVKGFASKAVARVLETLTLHTEILVFSLPPLRHRTGYPFPVTIWGYQPLTWFGRWRGDEAEIFRLASDEAARSVASAWWMTLVDPRWGRRRYLWDHIADVLTNGPGLFSAEPAPQ